MSPPTPVSRSGPRPLAHREVRLPKGDTLAAYKTLVRTVTSTLEQAFVTLPERYRATATLYVLAGDYSTFAVRRFAGRYHDAERRLRPSDSLAMETAELIRPFTTASEHRGNCYVLDHWPYDGPPPEARPYTRAGAAAVVCELAGDESGFQAITTVWAPGSAEEDERADNEQRADERAGQAEAVSGRDV